MAALRVLKGRSPGQQYPLEGERAVLGRHPDCDIVLEVGAVSRQHAQIVRDGEQYFVEDLHSRNGTFVNDEQIEGRRKLSENDQVKICDVVFTFHLEAPEAAAGDETTQTAAMMVDDDKPGSGSTIMSKLDVSSGTDGLRLAVNAEAKLKALLEIGRNLGKAVGLGEVLPKVLDSLFAIFIQADRGFVVLKDPRTNKLVPKAVRHRREKAAEQIRISRTIVNAVMAAKQAILSADAATDTQFGMSESIVDFQIHSMMCAPLIGTEGEVLGVLQIDTLDPRHRFNNEDLEVLASVACQAAIAVENAQLHEIAVQRQLLHHELDVAHTVQRGFLPAAPPKLDGYEFFDFYEPARQLGGDYFDYIHLPGGRLAIVLADVSGKGISAALFMAKLSSEAHYCLAAESTPTAAVGRLNKIFCESRWEDRFITMVLNVLDPATHELTIVNAGHMAPLRRRADGKVEAVGQEVGGLPLGVYDEGEYEPYSITLAPGDSITLYSDGIPDAMNDNEDFYGEERLLAQLGSELDGVVMMGERILNDIERFVGARRQTDDMCLTCYERVQQK